MNLTYVIIEYNFIAVKLKDRAKKNFELYFIS